MESGQDALRTVAWFCFSVEVVAIITRLALKWHSNKPYSLDDGLAIAAALFSLASATATTLSVLAGLAQTDGPSASDALHDVQLDAYVAEVFHAICMGTIKLSVLAFVNQIFRAGLPRLLAGVCAIVTSLWMLSSVLVILFQCSVPKTWDLAGGQCIDLQAFWQAFSAIDIATDVVIIAMPVIVTWSLQMPSSKKATIISCFLPWATTIAVAATSIVYARGFPRGAAVDASHIGRDLYAWFMCAQVLRTTAIMCACVPYLRHFLEAFPSGLLQADEIRRRGLTNYDVNRGFANQRTADGTVYYLYEHGDAAESKDSRNRGTNS